MRLERKVGWGLSWGKSGSHTLQGRSKQVRIIVPQREGKVGQLQGWKVPTCHSKSIHCNSIHADVIIVYCTVRNM